MAHFGGSIEPDGPLARSFTLVVPVTVRGHDGEVLLTRVLHRVTGHAGVDAVLLASVMTANPCQTFARGRRPVRRLGEQFGEPGTALSGVEIVDREVAIGIDAGVTGQRLREHGDEANPVVVVQAAEGQAHGALGERYKISPTMQAFVTNGVRTFYIKDGDGKQIVNPDALALIHAGDKASTVEEVRNRALTALAQEARMMLDEGVVATAAEIDLCMLLGCGWPLHLGGILPYLDREGFSESVAGQRFHPAGVASLPK